MLMRPTHLLSAATEPRGGLLIWEFGRRNGKALKAFEAVGFGGVGGSALMQVCLLTRSLELT
ncbi:hypothetical protein LMTR13_24540 [Bradyrhizobium icense]|uniref:Uncharacterized protein n=1 Tax=Bradyrhizobium icense TaxID=1274631 RepID=A0A1B1UJ94_9BRAD|nr:hypothetical protein LMTR13_24540 [Bradyrhizobium icense]